MDNYSQTTLITLIIKNLTTKKHKQINKSEIRNYKCGIYVKIIPSRTKSYPKICL